MQINVKGMLEETGLKVAENCFLRPPALPYIVFLENSNCSGADNKICLLEREITVELYSLKINREKENELEEILQNTFDKQFRTCFFVRFYRQDSCKLSE